MVCVPGSESLIADFSRPLASSDEYGDTTYNKTILQFYARFCYHVILIDTK